MPAGRLKNIVSRHHDTTMFSRLKTLFAKPPPREFLDSELGMLTLDCGVWIGTVDQDGRNLRFMVAGTEAAPDTGLLGRVHGLLARFTDTERIAMDFLRSRESKLHDAKLNFYSFEFLWEDRPDDFAFEFLAGGDDSRVEESSLSLDIRARQDLMINVTANHV